VPLGVKGAGLRTSCPRNLNAQEHKQFQLEEFLRDPGKKHPKLVAQTIFDEYPVARRYHERLQFRERAKQEQLERLVHGGGVRGRQKSFKWKQASVGPTRGHSVGGGGGGGGGGGRDASAAQALPENMADAYPDDEVDKAIRAYMERNPDFPVAIQKVAPNNYVFGDRGIVYVAKHGKHIVVRVGGGFKSLQVFMDERALMLTRETASALSERTAILAQAIAA